MKIFEKNAFTLVELIIVITILGLLATLAFISFKNYVISANDTAMLSQLKSTSQALENFSTQVGKYPLPDNYINLTASGNLFGIQGVIGKNTSGLLKISKIPTDFQQNPIIYSTNFNQKKYQVLSFTQLPIQTSFFFSSLYANPEEKHTISLGDTLGVVLDASSKIPESDIDFNGNNQQLKVIFNNSDSIVGSGTNIFSQITTRRDDLSKNQDFLKSDPSLVAYWDMESITSDGKLKDLSMYGNHGGSIGENTIGKVQGKISKASYFQGNNYITIPSSGNILDIDYPGNSITMQAIVKIKGTVDDPIGCDFGTSTSPIVGNYRYNLLVNGGHFITGYGYHDQTSPSAPGIGIDDQWRMVTFVKNGDKTHIYINGILANTKTRVDISDLGGYPVTDMFIGATQHCAGTGNKTYAVGIIDDIKIYNRALSQEEISQQSMIAGF